MGGHHGFRPRGRIFYEEYFTTSEIEKGLEREFVEEGKFYAIVMLVVHRDYEGQGVEQGLVNWLVKQAVVIPVLAVATPQQKELYERNGFQVKRTAGLVPGHERVYLVKNTAV